MSLPVPAQLISEDASSSLTKFLFMCLSPVSSQMSDRHPVCYLVWADRNIFSAPDAFGIAGINSVTTLSSPSASASLSACSTVRKLRPWIKPKQFAEPQRQLNGSAISDSVVR